MSRGWIGRVVGVQSQVAILQLDHQLDGSVMLARGEIEQRMIVAPQLGLHFFQWSHAFMLA